MEGIVAGDGKGVIAGAPGPVRNALAGGRSIGFPNETVAGGGKRRAVPQEIPELLRTVPDHDQGIAFVIDRANANKASSRGHESLA